MNAPPSVPLFAADRPHSKCSRRFFHFQFLLIGKAFTETRVQCVVLLIQKRATALSSHSLASYFVPFYKRFFRLMVITAADTITSITPVMYTTVLPNPPVSGRENFGFSVFLIVIVPEETAASLGV